MRTPTNSATPVEIASGAEVLIINPRGNHFLALTDGTPPPANDRGFLIKSGELLEITTIGLFGGSAFLTSVATEGSVDHASA